MKDVMGERAARYMHDRMATRHLSDAMIDHLVEFATAEIARVRKAQAMAVRGLLAQRRDSRSHKLILDIRRAARPAIGRLKGGG